jgi:hypothetical protein
MNHEADAIKARRGSQAALAEGYRQMAGDRDQEAKAVEWTEVLIGDTWEVGEGTAEEHF